MHGVRVGRTDEVTPQRSVLRWEGGGGPVTYFPNNCLENGPFPLPLIKTTRTTLPQHLKARK